MNGFGEIRPQLAGRSAPCWLDAPRNFHDPCRTNGLRRIFAAGYARRPRPLSLKTNPLVQIQLPYWELRNERCTCCDGQGALVFSTCPTCGWVVLICGEVGTVFEIRERHAGSRLGCIAAEDVCSQCAEKKYSDFCNATADEILSLGFQPADYR